MTNAKVKSIHRELLDSITNHQMRPWININKDIFYGKKEYIKDLSGRISGAKKFLFGDYHQIPDLDLKKADLSGLRLPYSHTLFELKFPNLGVTEFVVCREDENKKIECSVFLVTKPKLGNILYTYIPWLFTLEINDDGQVDVVCEEEQEFMSAYNEDMARIKNEIEIKKARLFKLEEEIRMAGNNDPMIIAAAASLRKRLDKQEQDKTILEMNDPGPDFNDTINKFFDKISSILLILNCANVRAVKHEPEPKLNKKKNQGRTEPRIRFLYSDSG